MADWGFNSASTRAYSDVRTANPGGFAGYGVQVSSGGANTKGSWVTVITSTASVTNALDIMLLGTNSSASFMLDIGINVGGTVTTIVPNLYFATDGSITQSWSRFTIPVPTIPAGANIQARIQGTSNYSVVVAVTALSSGLWGGIENIGKMTDYGSNTATTHGVGVVSGTGTKGSWVQVTASCDEIRYLSVMVGTTANDSLSHIIDIGIGSAGSEVVLIPDMSLRAQWYNASPQGVLSFPIYIAKGQRIAIRGQTTGASGTNYITLLGGA